MAICQLNHWVDQHVLGLHGAVDQMVEGTAIREAQVTYEQINVDVGSYSRTQSVIVVKN